ncbi:MAG: hypothetical protein GYA36_16155, partial [Veillonellaceae bacterium]|nr:hypothetical protein [Veillonellaceae bacterium]
DGEFKDLEGEARRVLEDAGVDYLDGYHVIKNEDQDNVRREGLKGSEWYGKPSGVYFLADPDDLGLAYPYVVGKMVSQKNKETMAVIHFRIPIDEIKNIQWDGKFNATFGTYSSFLNKGDIRPDQIVEIQHADFPTADEWNEKTKIPLYQGDVASSESLLYQAGDGDEAGLSNLKDIAHSFETWEEFASFVETMEVQNPSIPQDMSTIERQGWYKELWTQARQVNPIDLDDWVQRLEADNHAGLYDFLEGIWNEVLVPGSMRVFEGAEELSVAEKASGTKGELAETIVAGAQRVGSGKRNLDPRFIASLMGTIRKNPEEYARIYGQVMDQPEVGRLGAEAEKAKYADIEDPRLKTNRMSISQRAALASQIRDEKLAADVLTGRVAMDEKAKTYLDKLRSAQKAAKKKIADLTAELKVDEATLDEQDRRLAASRAESARTSQEIARAKKRIERFVEKGQKVPKGYESKLKTQEERAKALRSQLARIGDYEELDRQKRRLEEGLSRAELQAEEYRARGEATPLTLLRLRSELREQLRTLEPRLKAAGERWKDNAGLASYIAKAEAIAKEREKYQVREAEKRAFAKIRKYQKSLVNQIMRAPDERMYVAQQKAILEIQQLIDPAWRSEKTQEQVDELRAELEKNPEISREIPKEWLRRATGKNLNEMTLQELEETARKVDDLRTLGRVLKNRQDRARADWSEARVAEIIDAIEHSPGYKAPTGYEPEKDFLERFKDKVRTLDYSFLNMRRIANRLDGGTDGTNVKLLWHEMNRNYRKEMEGIDRRTQTIMQAFTDAGVKPEEWYNTSVTVQGAGPGGAAKVLRKSDLLALELAFRNEDSRAAALYGNFFSATERKQHEKDEDWFMVQGGAR